MNSTAATGASAPLAVLVARTPAAAFAVVMGLGGLALAWQRASHVLDLGAAGTVGVIACGALAVFAFVVVTALAVLRTIRHRDRVLAELAHPVKSAFVPAASISLVLIATVLLPAAPRPAEVLLWLGACAHLAITLRLLSWWINHPELDPKSVTPVWFIAPVGNLLVALPAQRLGLEQLAWFFFAVGFMLWLPMLAIVLWRLYFGGTLPPRLQPTLAILLAPPAVAFLGLTQLSREAGPAALVLYYFALFTLLLLLVQLPALLRLPFFLSWWAWSFPLAAFTVATLALAQALLAPWLRALGALLLAAATLAIGALLVRTLLALARREEQLVD